MNQQAHDTNELIEPPSLSNTATHHDNSAAGSGSGNTIDTKLTEFHKLSLHDDTNNNASSSSSRNTMHMNASSLHNQQQHHSQHQHQQQNHSQQQQQLHQQQSHYNHLSHVRHNSGGSGGGSASASSSIAASHAASQALQAAQSQAISAAAGGANEMGSTGAVPGTTSATAMRINQNSTRTATPTATATTSNKTLTQVVKSITKQDVTNTANHNVNGAASIATGNASAATAAATTSTGIEDEAATGGGGNEEEEEESSEISASDEDGSWISWFCSLRGNEFFCEVDEDYIQDDFNLTGLNIIVPYYDYALDMVLDVEMPMEETLTEHQQEIVESAAEMLYGLIHARYIVTNRGMHAMYEKYRSASFGRCPHVFCQGQPVLPVGLSDLPRTYTVNVFCPRCHGLFFPKSTRQANIDGAYFGTTFPHLYLMTHPDMIPAKPNQQYHPRVYGFKINKSSLYYRNHEETPAQRQLESGSGGRDRSGRRRNNRSGGVR